MRGKGSVGRGECGEGGEVRGGSRGTIKQGVSGKDNRRDEDFRERMIVRELVVGG